MGHTLLATDTIRRLYIKSSPFGGIFAFCEKIVTKLFVKQSGFIINIIQLFVKKLSVAKCLQ
jgi:hypothetical protein